MSEPKDYTAILMALDYIADSPAPEYGGFHPTTVQIAKDAAAAIRELEQLLIDAELGKLGAVL